LVSTAALARERVAARNAAPRSKRRGRVGFMRIEDCFQRITTEGVVNPVGSAKLTVVLREGAVRVSGDAAVVWRIGAAPCAADLR
jgi:hypothetical protein